MGKKILVVLSEFGYWGEELVGPLEVLDAAGYESVFMTPTGKKPVALPPSMEEGFWDPPLDKCVTDAYYAKLTRDIQASDRLDNPLSLEALFPQRPFFNHEGFGHKLEEYHTKREAAWRELEQYDALLLVGGSGPMIDMVNNHRLHDVVLGFHGQGKLIAAECYGVAVLAFARDFIERKCLIRGKHVTGHAVEYDWLDGTGVMGIDHNFKTAFYTLEFILRDAVGEHGEFHGGVGKPISTILDYPFLTGRSTQDSRLVGEKMVAALEHGLKRFGW
jgi:putative intracellular protease/amidase